MKDEKFTAYERTYWEEGPEDGNSAKRFVDPDYRSGDTSTFIEQTLKGTVGPWTNGGEFTIHELGCNVGRHLAVIKKEYPGVTVSGNDISETAITLGRERLGLSEEELIHADTFAFLEGAAEQGTRFNVMMTFMHLMHLNDDLAWKILPDLIPRVCDYFFCHELSYPGDTTSSGLECSAIWYARDYGSMFNDAGDLIGGPYPKTREYVTMGWKFENRDPEANT